MVFPTGVLPVKPSLRTSGWSVKPCPITEPAHNLKQNIHPTPSFQNFHLGPVNVFYFTLAHVHCYTIRIHIKQLCDMHSGSTSWISSRIQKPKYTRNCQHLLYLSPQTVLSQDSCWPVPLQGEDVTIIVLSRSLTSWFSTFKDNYEMNNLDSENECCTCR